MSLPSFGNRHSGRFPRLAVTVAGGGLVEVTYCYNRSAYSSDRGCQYILMSWRDLQRLVSAARAALPHARREGWAADKRKRVKAKTGRYPRPRRRP